jgi:hypothetical protein
MTKLIARIIIDSEDWSPDFVPSEDLPSLLVRKVVTSHARPFSEHELNYDLGMLTDQFFL